MRDLSVFEHYCFSASVGRLRLTYPSSLTFAWYLIISRYPYFLTIHDADNLSHIYNFHFKIVNMEKEFYTKIRKSNVSNKHTTDSGIRFSRV